MGARLMNARKKKRLAHRESRQKQRAQVAEAAPQPAAKSKPRKSAG